MNIILTLLILLLLVAAAFWLVDKARIRDPFNWLIKGAATIIALYIIFTNLVALG